MLQAKHCSRTLLSPHIYPLYGGEVTQSGEEKRKNREVFRKTRKQKHESPQRLTETAMRTTEAPKAHHCNRTKKKKERTFLVV